MESRKYEITYWIKADVKAEEIENKLLELLQKYGFKLLKKIPVKRKNLAYPIEKETIGQLGTIYFLGTNDKIEMFKEEVKKIKEILRFIILRRKYIKELILEEKNKTEEIQTVISTGNLNQ